MVATITHVWNEGGHDYIRIRTAEGLVDTSVAQAMNQQSWSFLRKQYEGFDGDIGKPEGPTPVPKGRNT